MPAYMSHAIMGNELYKHLKADNLLKNDINVGELRGYSLGADLAISSKNLHSDPHNSHTRDFFLKMINYIKNYKLAKNDHVIALLYGHISHYFFDINIHPLVYYFEVNSRSTSIIPVHHIIEGFYDDYFAEYLMNCDLMELNDSFFKINLENKENNELLNDTYGHIYSDYKIVNNYKKIMNIFATLEKVFKSKLFSKEQLMKLFNLKYFLKVNNLTYEELINVNNQIYTNPVTGEKHNESLIQLFNKSIDMSLEAIKDVNNYLYDNKSLSSLENTFTDLSYDTGVSCSLGKKLIYVRK